MKEAIRKHHNGYDGKVDGVLIFEMPTGTGYSHGEASKIDAFYMACRPSENFKRIAYEIKISRADFLREIKEPRKRRAALRVSNQFYFVTPADLVRTEEIPLECGLMELGPHGLYEKVNAPFRDGLPASWHFFAAFARRLQRLDEKENAGKP